MDIKKLEQMGMEQGFSHVALLDCDTIELKQEVRQMCAADTCHKKVLELSAGVWSA